MNERIKELAEQAGLRFTQLMSNPMVPVVDGRETDLAKFAELIIAECISACESHDVESFGINPVRAVMVTISCQKNIKEHFGVEK
jgi:hypothetical protein